MGNDQDHTIPASVSRAAAKRLGKSKAVVDYKEFKGRPHFTAGAPGWEAVADEALDWGTATWARRPRRRRSRREPDDERYVPSAHWPLRRRGIVAGERRRCG